MKISLLSGLLSSWFSKLVDFITGFFAFIPMSIYFIYASVASLLDFFQYVIRKLAGLDSYYVTINGVTEERQGDILVEFIEGILGINGSHGSQYQTLSTVFWSLIIFGAILVVLTTIISLIKSHYNYDAKKSQPMEIIKGSIKSLFTMALVPFVTIFGLYLSEIILTTLDDLTSASSGTNITALFGNEASQLKEVGTTKSGTKMYASFDFFGAGAPTNQTTFSGAMFKISARDCNRVRQGTFAPKTTSNDRWADFNIFLGDEETIAMRMDEAFASNLHLIKEIKPNLFGADAWVLSSAYLVGGGAAFGAPMLSGVDNFSKYDVGLVFYFYNLWGFNFFLAFAGIAAFLTLFINIIFGLMTRLLYCLALFLIYAPIVGISPLDGNKAFGQWKKAFLENVLMAYGTIVGMNIFFLILPFFDTVKFFNVHILDEIMRILIMMAGLVLVKKFMALLSGFIGGADANSTGNDVAEGVKKMGMSGAKATMGAAKLGIGVAGVYGKGVKFVANKIGNIPVGKKDASGKRKTLSETKFAKGVKTGAKVVSAPVWAPLLGAKKLGGFVKNKYQSAYTKEVEVWKNDKGEIVAPGTEGAKQIFVDKNDRTREVKSTDPNAVAATRRVMKEDSELSGIQKGLKAVGTGFVDIGGASLKLAGDLTGIAKFAKDMEETGGVFSAGKSAVQTFMQKVGVMQKDKDGKWIVPDGLKTKAQKDDADKAAASAQREAIESQAKTSRETLNEIKKLTAAIEKNKIK